MSSSRRKSPVAGFVFATLLVVVVGGMVLAGKPPKDPPPPPDPAPVKYQALWLEPMTPDCVQPLRENTGLDDIAWVELDSGNRQLRAVGHTSWTVDGEEWEREAVLVDVVPGDPVPLSAYLLRDLLIDDFDNPLPGTLQIARSINKAGLIRVGFRRQDDSGGYIVCETSGVPPYPWQEVPTGDCWGPFKPT